MKELNDETGRAQLTAITEAVRRAVAAESAVCIVIGDVDGSTSDYRSACMVSIAEHADAQEYNLRTALAILQSAGAILRDASRGRIEVVLRTPDGILPLPPTASSAFLKIR